MAIKLVGVLGCGLMGAGIAQVAAAAGFKTTVLEVNDGVLQKGLGRIDKFLSDGVAKGKVAAADREKTLTNLKGTTAYAVGAIVGAVLGAAIGQRWMSERATRYVLAAILLFAGGRLLLR